MTYEAGDVTWVEILTEEEKDERYMGGNHFYPYPFPPAPQPRTTYYYVVSEDGYVSKDKHGKLEKFDYDFQAEGRAEELVKQYPHKEYVVFKARTKHSAETHILAETLRD